MIPPPLEISSCKREVQIAPVPRKQSFFSKCINVVRRSTLLVPVAGAFTLGFVPEIRIDYYAVTSFCAVSAYSLLLNFPSLSYLMHRKPVYFDDLEDEEEEPSSEERKKYQYIFIRTIGVPLAVYVAILAGYFIYKMKTSTLSTFEIAGVIGGNMSLYNTGHKKVGQYLIDFLNWRKKKLQRRRRSSSTEMLEIV